jgi:hypothetical protein
MRVGIGVSVIAPRVCRIGDNSLLNSQKEWVEAPCGCGIGDLDVLVPAFAPCGCGIGVNQLIALRVCGIGVSRKPFAPCGLGSVGDQDKFL